MTALRFSYVNPVPQQAPYWIPPTRSDFVKMELRNSLQARQLASSQQLYNHDFGYEMSSQSVGWCFMLSYHNHSKLLCSSVHTVTRRSINSFNENPLFLSFLIVLFFVKISFKKSERNFEKYLIIFNEILSSKFLEN